MPKLSLKPKPDAVSSFTSKKDLFIEENQILPNYRVNLSPRFSTKQAAPNTSQEPSHRLQANGLSGSLQSLGKLRDIDGGVLEGGLVKRGTLLRLETPKGNTFPNGGFPLETHRTLNRQNNSTRTNQGPGFDTSTSDIDIMSMAEQREFMRGNGPRYLRGAMGPVSGKSNEASIGNGSRRSSYSSAKHLNSAAQDATFVTDARNYFIDAKRKTSTPNVRTDDFNNRSFLESSQDIQPKYAGVNRKKSWNKPGENLNFPIGGELDDNIRFTSLDKIPNSDVSVNSVNDRLTDSLRLTLKRRQMHPRDYLEDQQNDIFAQSIRRQSLRGTKHSLSESNLGQISERPTFQSDPESSEFDRHKSEPENLNHHKRNTISSHEDIQILNLQGFMDFAKSGVVTPKPDEKKKSRKRRIKGIEPSFSTSRSKERSHRRGRHRKILTISDDDDDLVIKDLDDLDDGVSGLVLGPKTIRESVGEAITLATASRLKEILLGSPSQVFTPEWINQSFVMNTNPSLSYGLIQNKGGPCGVLASVQAYMMKVLLFGSSISSSVTPVSPLRPSEKEWTWTLAVALAEIIWLAGGQQKGILALPGSFAHFKEHVVTRYTEDGLTELLYLHSFDSVSSLLQAVMDHISMFTKPSAPGCVLLVYSILLSRGLDQVVSDMDTGGGRLINTHGYASQEIVNLMLTGRATTNIFDGDKVLEDDRPDNLFSVDGNNDRMVLQGVKNRSEIGLLSLFEHYGSCTVGENLKTPRYPIWVVCSESHYSCLFSRETAIVSDVMRDSVFNMYFYDGLALLEDEVRLTIDTSGVPFYEKLVPPLEHCIRTKWPHATIDWNGTDPIL